MRKRGEDLKRQTGVTVYGVVALIGFVLVWALAKLVAGTAMYLFAYGLLLLFGAAFVLAPAQPEAHRRARRAVPAGP